MTPELAALLDECRLHLEATEQLFASLPERIRTRHLAARAHLLAERCEAAVREFGDEKSGSVDLNEGTWS